VVIVPYYNQLMKRLFRLIFRGNYQLKFTDNLAYSFLKSKKKVLDVGCGDGRFMALNPKKIQGIDGNRQTVTSVKKRGFSVTYAKATKLPFADKTFDGVHCSHVIEHMPPKKAIKLLQEASRVLKKNGVFVLRTPLLWQGFYDDFSHVKPYNPNAILRYMVHDGANKTLSAVGGRFEKIALIWRYRSLLDILYPLGIHRLEKNGYILVLKKIVRLVDN